MNIYETLLHAELSTSEETLRDLILKDPIQFLSMRTDEIIKTCHVSRSSIYRLCEKAGCDGFSELKLRLSADLDSWKASNQSFNYDYPVTDGMSVQTIASKLKEDYEKTVLSTSNLLDVSALRTAARAMQKADLIDIYTSAGNIYFADNFAFQMQEIGKTVKVPHELYLQLLTASSSDNSHFAIVISFGGRNMQMEQLCRTLKETGTKILLICSQQAEKLFPYADMRLYFCANENHYRKISSFSTRLSLLYILDTLYTCCFELNYDENIKKKDQYYKRLSNK